MVKDEVDPPRSIVRLLLRHDTGERLESGVEVHLLEYVDAYPYTRDTSPEDWGTDGVSLLPDEILKWSTFQKQIFANF